ncbi:PilZ domain-containing protein [Sphingomonas sp. PAMC 26621]|uniref:PilZ domain-containing protein n=1 Tax=Sphingomonas sp. PAMC 26621 TaxID=1112213 RepID=UPI000289543C|nr:PilZ domain-containing protein [Sphingomonas sp. PAMC 26621]
METGTTNVMDQYSPTDPQEHVDDPASGRQDARDSLFLMAMLRLAGETGSIPVRVRNLSAGGLMADYPEGLDQAVPVQIEIRGIGWVPGQVAWCTAGRIGIAFDRPIDPLLARKPVGQGGHTPVFVKPILPRGNLR